MKFIDEVKIQISSGHGGAGSVSFRREAMVPRGGPDGGDGGKGGSVIIKTTPHLNSLMDFRSHKKYSAERGQPGAGANMSGADGQDLVLMVPSGTIIRHESGEVITDLTDIKEFLILKGGRGGKGNTFFKNSVNQAPEHAQPGEEGETLDIILELKLIADVGIIGFPNAGKSTLISRISAAKPKIADYPFTTLVPNLGVVKVGDYHSFVVADIPGLIEGASEGVGLGIQFLKHIERTNLFLHLVDVSGQSGRDPVDDYETIMNELKLYDEQNQNKEGFRPLSDRNQIVVLNKIDAISKEQVEVLERKFKKILGEFPRSISAVSGVGVKELILEVSRLIIRSDDEVEVQRDL
jgi:GTP-binding protein